MIENEIRIRKRNVTAADLELIQQLLAHEGCLDDFPTLTLTPVRRTPQEKIYNGLIGAHHYLGYTQGTGEHTRGDSAHGRGANRGEGGRIHDRAQAAVLAVEQEHRPLRRIKFAAFVAVKDGDDFQTHGIERGRITRHQTHEAFVLRQAHDRSQRQHDFAFCQALQRRSHDFHALGHEQELINLFAIEDERLHKAKIFCLSRGKSMGLVTRPSLPFSSASRGLSPSLLQWLS